MNKILIAITFLFIISCEEVKLDDIAENNSAAIEAQVTANIINPLVGVYSSCTPSLSYAGYYEKNTVTITSTTYEHVSATHSTASCNSVTGVGKSNYNIKKATISVDDPTIVLLDLENVAYYFQPNHSWYISQNYCGLTNIPLTEFTEYTGLSCPDFLDADSHHSSFAQVGDIEYSSLTLIDSNTIKINSGFSESGDSEVERHSSDQVQVTK
jgi:hypothetical protein